MKRAQILAAVAALQLAGMSTASATEFLYTGSIQSYTVPTTGWYSFTVAGAQAASFLNLGGGGAVISGSLHFDQVIS